MIFFIEFFLEFLIDSLIFFTGGEERSHFDRAEGSKQAESFGVKQPEKRSVHSLYLRYNRLSL